jgi:hypothetical protein
MSNKNITNQPPVSPSKTAKSLASLKEGIKNDVINWNIDMQADHLRLKQEVFAKIEKIVKSRLKILNSSVGNFQDINSKKYDAIAEKTLAQLDKNTAFSEIWEKQLGVLEQTIRNIKQLDALGNKTVEAEGLMKRKLREQEQLIREINKAKFENCVLESLVKIDRELRKAREESDTLVKGFQRQWVDKLSTFLEYYEDLRESGWKVDMDEEEEEKEEREGSFLMQVERQNKEPEVNEMELLKKKLMFFIQNQPKDGEIDHEKLVDEIIDFWETKI